MIVVPKILTKPRISFDPKGFKDARKRFASGDPAKIIAMFQEAETDSHVAGCLLGRRSGYKRAYSVAPFEETSGDNEAREWIKGVLEQLSLRDLLESIHQAALRWYSVIDFEWEIIDNRDVPISFEFYDQQHFAYDRERILKLREKSKLVDIPEEALVVQIRSHKTPVMLPVLRDFILKEFGVQAWASFLEQWGAPFILGRYPAGSDDDFKKQVQDAVEAVQSSAAGIAPEGTEFQAIEVAKSAGDHELFVKNADRGIAIAILGHANAVEQSSGLQVGANLDAFEVRFNVAEDDMYFVEPHVNRLIRMIYDRNFSDGRHPRFELAKAKPINAKEHMDIVDKAFSHGLEINPSEYSKMGLIVSPDQEPLTKPTRPLDILMD